jgi:hypothetical protein
MTEADANTAVNAVDNLRIGEVTYEPNDTVAAGLVLSQDPAGGTTVLTGSSVDLVVSSGKVYELTVTVFGGNGTVEPNAGFYPAGTVVTLTAAPEEPYCLARWTGTDNDSSYALTNTVTMSGDRIVAVEFRLPHMFFVPGHYVTIQDAIDAAGNCDVVIVSPGTYRGNISFNGKNITVTSMHPDDPCVVAYTVIDGTGEGSSVVTFSGSEDESCVLDGLTITGGNTPGNGGGICGNGTDATIVNCVITGNHADGDGGGVSDCNGLIRHCTISENSADRGGGVFGVDVGPSMTDCRLSGNWAASDGGGLFCYGAATSILRCTIVGNSADGWGGGMYLGGAGSPQVVNCLVAGNSAAEGGGGIYAGWYAEPTISNCTIVDNTVTAGNGGGVCCSYASSAFTVNSIVWGNLGLAGAQIALISEDMYPLPSVLVVTYSDVEGGPAAAHVDEGCILTWGQGSIDSDPLFVGSEGGDYHLMPASPCVDAGDNSFVPPSVLKDLDGSPRIANGTVDMGVYEVLCYHVDGLDGDDSNDGLSRETAFATIQKGIDTAEDYDTVLVYPAVYTEELDFLGKAIMVKSADEPAVLRAPDYYAVSFYHEEDGNSILKNFIITDSDVGFLFFGASPTINHVTVADCNLGADASGGAEPVITNSIFWNNRDGDLLDCQGQYSCIENGSAGQGNISKDPCFVDADNGDYHLRSEGWRWAGGGTGWAWDDVTSPCIDAGNPGTCLANEPMSIPRDPDNIYGVNIRVNMGAYGGTSQASIPPHNWAMLADLNNDGIVDWRDADLWAHYWLASGGELPGDLDRTGQVDGLDFALLGVGWMQATTWWSCLVPTPPAPDPMRWDYSVDSNGLDGRPWEILLPPYTYWDYGHTMRADPNTTDEGGWCEFYFECTDFPAFSSGWLSFPAGPPYVYTTAAIGLPGYEPSFRVKARDFCGNETGWSETLMSLPWEDTTAPAPAPYLLTLEPVTPNTPNAPNTPALMMTASEAYDISGLQYYFQCTSVGGHDSGWQDEVNYTDVNLIADSNYCYRVKARDKSPNRNETAWSVAVCATANGNDQTPPAPDPMQWDFTVDASGFDGLPREVLLPPYTYWDYGHTMRADPNTTDDSGSFEFYFECKDPFSHCSSGWISFPGGPPYIYTTGAMGLPGFEPAFRAKARDMWGNETAWSAWECSGCPVEPTNSKTMVFVPR